MSSLVSTEPGMATAEAEAASRAVAARRPVGGAQICAQTPGELDVGSNRITTGVGQVAGCASKVAATQRRAVAASKPPEFATPTREPSGISTIAGNKRVPAPNASRTAPPPPELEREKQRLPKLGVSLSGKNNDDDNSEPTSPSKSSIQAVGRSEREFYLDQDCDQDNDNDDDGVHTEDGNREPKEEAAAAGRRDDYRTVGRLPAAGQTGASGGVAAPIACQSQHIDLPAPTARRTVQETGSPIASSTIINTRSQGVKTKPTTMGQRHPARPAPSSSQGPSCGGATVAAPATSAASSPLSSGTSSSGHQSDAQKAASGGARRRKQQQTSRLTSAHNQSSPSCSSSMTATSTSLAIANRQQQTGNIIGANSCNNKNNNTNDDNSNGNNIKDQQNQVATAAAATLAMQSTTQSASPNSRPTNSSGGKHQNQPTNSTMSTPTATQMASPLQVASNIRLAPGSNATTNTNDGSNNNTTNLSSSSSEAIQMTTQMSTTNQQQQMITTIGGQLPSRPQSAMAGSLAFSSSSTVSSSNYGGGFQSIERRQQLGLGQSQTQLQQRPQQMASSTQNLQTTPRAKTTRVRINSTSEQIQDPNWLIRMSKEMEQARYKKSHLKKLHRKLKSTLTSATTSIITGGSESSSSNSANNHLSGNSDSLGNSYPISSPVTPVKIPVSILKQPSSSAATTTNSWSSSSSSFAPAIGTRATRSSNVQNQSSLAQNISPNSSATQTLATTTTTNTTLTTTSTQQPQQRQKKSNKNRDTTVTNTNKQQPPVQISISTSQNPSSQTGSASNQINQPQAKQSDDREVESGANLTSNSRPSSRSSTSSSHLQQKSGRSPTNPQQSKSTDTSIMHQQQAQLSSETKSRPVPICADGQVKVSGWKRNNLLAKTLGHLDEIRGNQRPIFLPTKITLPTVDRENHQKSHVISSPSSSPSAATAAAAERKQRRDNTKFAELVREAISKKKLLAANNANTSTSSTGHQSTKRTSDGEVKSSSEHRQLTLDHHEAKRSASAGAGSNINSGGGGHNANNSNQHRLSGDIQQDVRLRSSSAMGSHSSPQSCGGATSKSSNQNRSANGSIKITHHPSPSTGSSPIRGSLVSTNMFIQQASHKIDFTDMTGGPASARQLKLQLKNNQLLQNLRRQSNETQRMANELATATSAAASGGDHSVGGGGDGSGGGEVGPNQPEGAHLKDWKRLTNKLGLLTGRNFRLSARSNLLSAIETSSNHKNSNSSGPPLRLTVSNQESGCQGRRTSGTSSPVTPTRLAVAGGGQKRSSGGGGCLVQQPQQLTVPGQLIATSQHKDTTTRHRASDGGVFCTNQHQGHQHQQERKLSSSSMVVQPVSGPHPFSSQVQFRSATGSPMASNSFAEGCGRKATATSSPTKKIGTEDGDSQVITRRCSADSDSSAFKTSSPNQTTGESELTVFTNVATTSTDTSSDLDAVSHLTSPRPVVVNRDDLLHLLKVTNQQTSASQSSSRRDSVSSEASRASKQQILERRSLELDEVSGDLASLQSSHSEMGRGKLRNPLRRARSSSLKSLDHSEQLQKGNRKNGDKDGKSVMILKTSTGNGDNKENQSGGESRTGGQGGKQSKRHDFLWVVSRTSKVAFFHKKLRKIGWHHKQQQQQQQQQQQIEQSAGSEQTSQLESLASADLAASSRVAGEKSNQTPSNSKSNEASGNQSDQVALDPNLIGDAIEIFLRTAMQSSPCPSTHEVGAAETQPATGQKSSLEEKDEEFEEASGERPTKDNSRSNHVEVT